MKILCFLLCIILLTSCENKKIEEIDLSQYFSGINGTAVFYNPATQHYKIHNIPLSQKRSSPCSTFKIISSYIALSEKLVSLDNSEIRWNKTTYWRPQWNKDMTITEAFKESCVWYYRKLIDKAGPKIVASYLSKYHYGNQDISDWQGEMNTNTGIAELKGFWIESSLQITPLEQTEVLSRIFQENQTAVNELKQLMLVSNEPIKIYGKTGMGVKDDKIADAWFVGFYEKDNLPIYFAVRLDDAENENFADYRNQASQIAKAIALEIIHKQNL